MLLCSDGITDNLFDADVADELGKTDWGRVHEFVDAKRAWLGEVKTGVSPPLTAETVRSISSVFDKESTAQGELYKLASALTERAQSTSRSTTAVTPFSQFNASQRGGKPDDTTVLAAIVVPDTLVVGGMSAWLARGTLANNLREAGAVPALGTPAADAATDTGAGTTGCLASMVLAADGALVRIGMTRRLRLVWQAAAALAALHERRMMHGAVTPANVLLSPAGEGGEAAVRVVGLRQPAGGTGSTSAVDDTYSWGALAWQVLTAQAPVAGVALENGRAVAAALDERGVPAVVVDIICACLAPVVEARPTMAAVVGVLASALATIRWTWGGGLVASLAGAGEAVPPPSADAAQAAMRQLASESATRIEAQRLVGRCGAAVATLREYLGDVAVVRAACAALRNLCGVCDSVSLVWLQDGRAGSGLATALRVYCHDGEVLRATVGALHNLAANPSARWLLLHRDGAGGALAAALRSDAADAGVVHTACTTLQLLGVDKDTAKVLYRDGCGPAVVAVLQRHVGDTKVMVAACGALRGLALAKSYCADLVRDGAGAAAVAALQRHAAYASVALECCWALSNILRRIDLFVRDDSAASAAPGAIVAVLKQHGGNAAVVYPAVRTMWRMTSDVPMCGRLVRDHGALHELATALQRHSGDVDVAEAACGMLANLVSGFHKLGTPLIAEQPLVDRVTAALQRHARVAKVAETGCVAVGNLAATANVERVICNGTVVGLVVEVFKIHVGDAPVARAAVRALRDMSANAVLCDRLVRWPGTVATLVEALQRHPDDEAMALSACGALNTMAASADKRGPRVVDQPVVDVLVATLQRHASAKAVAEEGCSALASIAGVVAQLELFARDDSAGAAIVAALRLHADDAYVTYAGACALQNMSASGMVCAQLGRDYGTLAALATALQQHDVDVGVARAACGALRNLTTPVRDMPREPPVVEDAVVDALTAVLQRHAADVDVAEDGCWVLARLADVEVNRLLLARDAGPGATAVVAVLAAHVNNAEVALAALAALRSMSASESLCAHLVAAPAGTLAALATALQRHGDDVEVARAACGTLNNLATPAASYGPLAVEQPVVDALTAALQRHADDGEVATVGSWAASRLADVPANAALTWTFA